MATDTESAAHTFAEPQREHDWLQRLVGDWTYDAVAQEPGKEPEKASGTETVRSIGGLWTMAEALGEMPGGGLATAIMTLGFDPQKQRYVGTWVGSMMASLWVYDGTLDEKSGRLTLDTEGPSFSGDGTLSQYRDVIEFRSDDHRVHTSQVNTGGKWQQFMTMEYRRRK
jgi:hypothetical protein